MRPKPLFLIKELYAGYRRNEVLKAISFEIEQGEFLGIIGPNGSGKSTLLRSLSRSLKPSQGCIVYGGSDLYTIKCDSIAKDFAFVAQDNALHFLFTCWDIVLMGRTPYLRRLTGETKSDIRIVKEAMAITETLSLADRYTNEVSAGERQMVMIAKALAQQPKVLFLDEPTAHLDIGHQTKILNLLKRLNKEKNLTTIIVLHDLNLASMYCDRIALLHRGTLKCIGSSDTVLTYEQIEDVYATLVLVHENPICNKPHILLIGKEKIKKGE